MGKEQDDVLKMHFIVPFVLFDTAFRAIGGSFFVTFIFKKVVYILFLEGNHLTYHLTGPCLVALMWKNSIKILRIPKLGLITEKRHESRSPMIFNTQRYLFQNNGILLESEL